MLVHRDPVKGAKRPGRRIENVSSRSDFEPEPDQGLLNRVFRALVVEPRTSSQTVEILAAADIDSLDDVIRDMNADQVESIDGPARAGDRPVAAALVTHGTHVGH